MRLTTLLLLSCLWITDGYSQFTGLRLESNPVTAAGFELYQTHRIYVQTASESDQLIMLFGGGGNPDFILGSSGLIYQDPAGGPTSLDISASSVDAEPLLYMDSFVTIGMMDDGLTEDNLLMVDDAIDFNAFESGSGSIIMNAADVQSIQVPEGSTQGLAGVNKEVCIAQLTTMGMPEGKINFTLLSGGVLHTYTDIDLQGISACTDPSASNYNADAVWNDGSCDYSVLPVTGCTDPLATNYNPDATVDDGSCTYPVPQGCTDPLAINYDPSAETDDGSCIYPIQGGCMDPEALNYDPNAETDDGSCIYPPQEGCTDPTATNYDPAAETDDGSCIYPPQEGCTDPEAVNFDDSAEVDDGSCLYAGCTNAAALNFDPSADIDNGTCIMDCSELPFNSSLNQMENGDTFPLCINMDNEVFPFAANFTGFGPELSSVSIDWGDGTVNEYELIPLMLEHEYLSSGDFQLMVTVTGAFGCAHSTSYHVHSGHVPVIDVAMTTGSTAICVAEEIGFDLLNWENNDPDTQYKIQYTDNTETFEMSHPPFIDHTHSFDAPSCLSTGFDGTPFAHGIKVIALNGCGSSFAMLPAIRVSGPTQLSELSFFGAPQIEIACPGEEFTFVNTSNGFYLATDNGCVSNPPSDWNITPSTGWEVVDGGLQNPDFVTVRFDDIQSVQVGLSAEGVCGTGEIAQEITIVEAAGLALGEVSINGTATPDMEVQVFAWSEDAGEFVVAGSVLTDESGHYESLLPAGQYQIKAHPDPIDHPGVLALYTNGVWKWGEAEIIEVGCLSEIQADIALDQYNDSGVNVTVGGTVYYRDVVKSSQQGDPIPGIPIIVEKDTTNTQEAVVSTLTNALGEYYFSNLPPGNYKLHIDIPGLPVAETHYFSVTEAGESFTDLNFYADSLDRIYISDLVSVFEIQQTQKPFRVFPNPGRDVINLELIRGDLHEWQLQIFDSQGREVHVNKESIGNRWMIDCSDWPSGMYHLQATGNSSSYRGTIVVN